MTPIIERIETQVYTIPTDFPEADGTAAWKETSVVVAKVYSEGVLGIGYSYADPAAATIIQGKLAEVVVGKNALSIPECWEGMIRTVRNLGRPGVASHSISAMDIALWDLKAQLLGLPILDLLGRAKDTIPIYGSGGFTSYPIERLQEQLKGWVDSGISMVKMKVGTDPKEDPIRVRAAREAIGDQAQLFVDANGAYSRIQALRMSEQFEQEGVKWFEEPVSSDDLEGLRFLRDRCPPGMEIAAGEYGYDSVYFKRMLGAQAVDVLQADATRCLGISGFMKVAALCEAWMLPLSAHTSPSIHAHLCCASPRACHVEYFHDHVRIERILFDGALSVVEGEGVLRPSPRHGLGLKLRASEAKKFAA